jgi:hypothetical protein
MSCGFGSVEKDTIYSPELHAKGTTHVVELRLNLKLASPHRFKQTLVVFNYNVKMRMLVASGELELQ